MKCSKKFLSVLVVFIAGSVFFGTQPASAGILSKLGLDVDEINITLKGKNSRNNNPPAPPQPQAHQRNYQPRYEPPRGPDPYAMEHARVDWQSEQAHREIEAQKRYNDNMRRPCEPQNYRMPPHGRG